MHDVLVVGSGPAGSAAALGALHARPGASVLLVDRADFPRDKACGDGVAPHALDVLASLGVRGLLDDAPPVDVLHLVAGAASVRRPMARPARVVPRRVLDARLREAALAAGAEPLQHRASRVEQRPDGVVVDGHLAARVLVVADGARSRLRTALGVAPAPDGHVAVALRGYAPVRDDLAAEQRIAFGERGSAGARDGREGGWPAYAWSFPLGDGRANVGYGELVRRSQPLTRERMLERLEDLLPGAGEDAQDLRAAHLPLSSRRPPQAPGRVLLAGDAASLVNPLTGEGIYYAVASGALAGRAAVLPGDPGRAYAQALGRLLGRHLQHTRAAAALARRPVVLRAGLAAARDHGSAFDDLVEIGLGRGLLRPRTVLALASALASGAAAPARAGRRG